MTVHETGPSVDRKDVEKALDVILSSSQFSGSSQLGDFLSYIVKRTLDGEQDELKAYPIAVDALGREEDFDPQSNAAVRVAAGRLRQALAVFNASDEAADLAVKITLDPGSYVPQFSAREPLSPPEPDEPATETTSTETFELQAQLDQSGWIKHFQRYYKHYAVSGLVVLAVMVGLWQALPLLTPKKPPDATTQIRTMAEVDVNRRAKIALSLNVPDQPYPDWFNQSEVHDSMSLIMARFDDYEFMGTRLINDLRSINSDGLDYHLVVSAYRRGDLVRFIGKLLRVETGSIIWTAQRTFSKPTEPSLRNVPDIAGQIYSPVASPYGVIYSDLLKEKPSRPHLQCLIMTYQYFSRKTDQGHREARECSEQLVEQGSRLPNIYVSLTFLYLDEYREFRNPKPRDPLRAAEKMAKLAVQYGPQSARAYQAHFAVHKVLGHVKLARSEAERAVALNPYDSDILGDYGAWLLSQGEIELGVRHIERAERMMGSHPAWFDVYRFLARELSGNESAADELARSFEIARSPLMAALITWSAVRTNNADTAIQAVNYLREAAPYMLEKPKEGFLRRGFSEEIAEKLAARFTAAYSTIATD